MDSKTLYRLKAFVRRSEKSACLTNPSKAKLLAEISDIGVKYAKALDSLPAVDCQYALKAVQNEAL